MAMLLSCFSRFSSAPRRALCTSAWLATLAVLMFAGQAWGQQQFEFDQALVNEAQGMKTVLADSNGSVPTAAADAFDDMPQSFQDELAGLTLPNANHVSLDQEGNGFLNPSEAKVVDWVLVQARVVNDGGPSPYADGYCSRAAANDDISDCVTQAGLLMADGIVLGVDENGALVEEFIFEGLDYDSGNQALYIAIQHRNHLGIISSEAAAGAAQNDVYVYDFSNPSNIDGSGFATGLGRLLSGRVAMRGGDADPNNSVFIPDFSAVVGDLGRDRPYSSLDVNMDGRIGIGDFSLVVKQLGRDGFKLFN